MKYAQKKKTRANKMKIISIFLLLLFIFQIGIPTVLAGGPNQPETATFTPASADNLVDPFTGDFSYNIPLLEVDGYPLNLAYNAGITPEQEASWVGLGWNLNPGAITRDVRGLPDDFKGDPITYIKNIKKNVTVGVSGGVGTEIVGFPLPVDVSAGLSYNNYQGFDLTTNAGITLGASIAGKFSFNSALSINNSSMNGITISPSISLSSQMTLNEKANTSLSGSLTASSSYNSRSGVQQVGYGTDVSISYDKTSSSKFSDSRFATVGLGYSLPRVNSDFDNFSITGRFTLGGELFWTNGHGYVNGFYSEQRLRNKVQLKKAYGCLNSSFANNPKTDIMDFSRENENGFSFEMPALPLARMNQDILTVSGQGISGSYKPYANAFGVIRDPSGESKSSGISLGVELNAGNVIQGGGNVQKNTVNGHTGSWESGNTGMVNLGFKNPKSNSNYENVYYQEANEKGQFVNTAFYNSTGRDKAVRFAINKISDFEHTTTPALKTVASGTFLASNNFSYMRAKRNKPVALITAGEVMGGAGITKTAEWPSWSQYSAANPHHIGEISITGEDGKRYIYGLPVYNAEKRDITFAVGTTSTGHEFEGSKDCSAGTITYTPGTDDDPDHNEWGLDNYYEGEFTPAYAHSYLPTCILGVDYVDADDLQGPSDDDFGEWVKFDYTKMDSLFRWRIPFLENQAIYNPGMETDKTDDKASYVYGEKELVYLKTIETRNYVLRFLISDREDGYGVKGTQGGIDTSGTVMQKLDSIQMFTKKEYLNSANPIPVKTVHFDYDDGNGGYDLCTGVFSNSNSRGKLTLHKVYFTYRTSNRGKYNPYVFEYNGEKPVYSQRSVDRWGYYKTPVSDADCNISASNNLTPAIYPYTEQDLGWADDYASAWNLTGIKLPSGGKIEVDYEADRYQYVQNKKATVMKVITRAKLGEIPFEGETANLVGATSGGYIEDAGLKLGFDLNGHSIQDYATEGQLVYFRCLVQLGSTGESDRSDFISGYATVAQGGLSQIGNIGYIRFKNIDIHGIGYQNPILVAALQYARLHLSHMVYGTQIIPTDGGLSLQLLKAVINSFDNLGNMFSSPNAQILNNNRARRFFLKKSWLKLNNPVGYKIGGGNRVKEIRMYDNWDQITGVESGVATKKTYDYTLSDGTSSGVASNEPMMGGEENSLTKPFFLNKEEICLAPDNRYYIEEPFAKSFFPSPSVGYSRVTVRDYEIRGDYTQDFNSGTGYTVNEFYTAKDFPSIYGQTDIDQIHDKTPAVSFAKLFGHNVKDFITFSQGFMVETNDMHGKQKKVSIYAEGQDSPIQYTIYKYKDKAFSWQGDSDTRRLVNDANTVIASNGTVQQNIPIGIFYNVLADSKEETSDSEIATTSANIDASLAFIIPIIIPTVFPKKSSEHTGFKYASVTKTIEKFGILEKVTSFDQGTLSEETYLASDAETGAVLVTQTQNNFNDSYYTMHFPAYWGYDGMGSAYRNIGFFKNGVSVNGNGTLGGVNTSLLTDGDEIVLKQGDNYKHAWVMKNSTGTRVFDSDGVFPMGSYQYIKVFRSGRRNLLNQNMMDLITLENPLNGLSGDTYTQVVSATGTEYGNVWRTLCNCFGPETTTAGLETTNPFKMGARGLYRPLRAYTYLTSRTQTDYNENTNIRRDGVFSSFNPLYHRDGGNWGMHPENWTFSTEVTEYSPEGYALASRDALGRYSSSLYGYNRSLQVAMAQNANQKEIGFDGFEDSEDASCGTDHMRFVDTNGISTSASHSGHKSMLVSSGNSVSISRDLQECSPIYEYSCNLVLDQTYNQNGQLVITIGCYTAPLSIEYEILQGNSVVDINENVITITNPSGNYTPGIISLSISDAENCIYEDEIIFQPVAQP